MSEFAVISSLIFYIYYSIFFRKSQIFFCSLQGRTGCFRRSQGGFLRFPLSFSIYIIAYFWKKVKVFYWFPPDVDGARSIFLWISCVWRLAFMWWEGRLRPGTFYPCNRHFPISQNILPLRSKTASRLIAHESVPARASSGVYFFGSPSTYYFYVDDWSDEYAARWWAAPIARFLPDLFPDLSPISPI